SLVVGGSALGINQEKCVGGDRHFRHLPQVIPHSSSLGIRRQVAFLINMNRRAVAQRIRYGVESHIARPKCPITNNLDRAILWNWVSDSKIEFVSHSQIPG